TGYPATSDVISATVISTDGMMADAFATAAVVLGSEKALDLFAKSNVRAALITKEKKVITYNVEVTIKDASYVTE
ncbi:MAG: FAD:protein FMN transferase, partial [Clostridia bacterium]|nr:FAD:protein FMN transferase [Clostridia bacterium]